MQNQIPGFKVIGIKDGKYRAICTKLIAAFSGCAVFIFVSMLHLFAFTATMANRLF